LIRESQTFGSRLRAERESRGISLDSIAEKTKIKKSFLDSLERGDFSKWPAGTVFRRAYVRDYAAVIGLSPESVVADFIRLFPVDAVSPATPTPLALTFDTPSNWRSTRVGRRARTAAIDATGLLALGGILALLTGSNFWTAAGTLALVYYPATYAVLGCSIASHYLDARSTRRQVIAIAAPRIVIETASPGAPEHVAALPVQMVASRLEEVVDPLLLTAASRAHSAHVQQETTAH
jgi:hypothetical protein